MSRDFIYIDDIVSAICMGMDNSNMTNGIFNVGSGVSTTVMGITNILKEKLNSKSRLIITGERRVGDIRHNFANMSKSRSLGFESKTDIYSGLSKFTDWVKTQEISETEYEGSLDELRKNKLLIKD